MEVRTSRRPLRERTPQAEDPAREVGLVGAAAGGGFWL